MLLPMIAVGIVPLKAEAATPGTYYYKVTFEVTNDMDNVQMKWSLTGKTNNGTGSETSMASGGDYYVRIGYKLTTNPVASGVCHGVGIETNEYGNYQNADSVSSMGATWYKVNSDANSYVPKLHSDGNVDLNRGAGGKDIKLLATYDTNYGPPIDCFTILDTCCGESISSYSSAANYYNGAGWYRCVALNSTGNYPDLNRGAGGEDLYGFFHTPCEVINSDNLRTAYNYAKYQYENGYSSASGLASALTNAENTLSDLNDGYTTRSQSTIDQYTRALYEAMPTIAVNTEYNVAIGTANMQRYFRFTPSTSGTYVFYSYGSGDTQGYIYNKTTSGTSIGSTVTSNDDASGYIQSTLGNNSYQFYMTASLTANTTYYFMVKFYSTNTGTVKFKVANARNITFNTTGGATTTTLTLPQGYDTVLAENGAGLSQGEKQLICITRVMLRDTPILILDEATSSIDLRTEIRVQRAFNELMSEATCFVVAHRLSTIMNADNILCMDAGRIVEQGTHKELLAKNGFYASLWHSQFAGAGNDEKR